MINLVTLFVLMSPQICCLDLAARNIVGHSFSDSDLKVTHLLDTAEQDFKRQRSFTKNTDYTLWSRISYENKEYTDFLEEKQMKTTNPSATGHGNQVIKRIFKTIKGLIRKRLPLDWKVKRNHFNSFQQKALFISEIIESYNNKVHKTLLQMTPNTIFL